jgi:hypothetical protein
LIELRKLLTAQPHLRGVIEIIERFLLEFDRLAAAQRVVAVDREKVVEKEIERGVLVPVNNIRNELAMSLLVEKLILEIKRIKKENPNIRLSLDDEIGLVFFTELFDKANINLSGDFQSNLKRYVEQAIAKFTKSGGKWSTDHELMLHTMLGERFAMASAIKYANEEIEKAKALAELKGAALREKETQFQALSKTVQDLYRGLSELQGSGYVTGNSSIARYVDTLGNLVNTTFTVHIGEPTRILGDFEGSGNDFNRLLSFIRERDAEVELLKTRLVDNEKRHIHTEFVEVDAKRTIDSLRQENAELSRTIDQLRSSSSQAVASSTSSGNRERELELKLKTANSRIQELESQLRSAELQLKQYKDTNTSANTSRVDGSQSNLVSSQYSSSSSSNKYGTTSQQGATYGSTSGVQPSYGQTGIAGTATTTSTYQTGSGSGSAYQTTSSVGGTGATTYGTGATTYGSGSGANYGTTNTTLTGSRTGATTGSTTGATTTGATSATTYGSTAGRTSGATSGTTTSGTTGTTSYGSSGTTTYGSSGSTGATGATGSGSSTGAYGATSYGQRTTGASYGTGASGSVTSSQSGASYGQSAGSSISSSTTGGQGYTSTYQRTTGTTGTTGTTSSGLSSSGAGSSGASSSNYTFQTKKY